MEKFCANATSCSNNAQYCCCRCESEFYCSRPCQVKAWPTHRMFCFTMPDLKRIGSRTDLDVTIHEDVPSLTQKVKEISLKEDINPPKAAFDQGVTTRPPAAAKEPKMTVPTPKTETFAAEKAKEITKAAVPTFSRSSTAKKPLIEPEVQPTKPKAPVRFMKKDLKYSKLPKKLQAFLLSGSPPVLYLSLANTDTQDYLQHIEKNIENYTKTAAISPYKPIKGEVVLATFEGKYCRALVESVEGDKFGIIYIDYGDQAEVVSKDLLPIPESLMFEVVVHEVEIQNFPEELTNDQMESLNSQIVNLDNVTPKLSESGYTANIIF